MRKRVGLFSWLQGTIGGRTIIGNRNFTSIVLTVDTDFMNRYIPIVINRNWSFPVQTSNSNALVEKVNAQEQAEATMSMNSSVKEQVRVVGEFHVQHVRNGKIIHEEKFPNLVTTVGKNDLLDKYLKGSAYTQTIRMGLKGVGTAVVGDTQASHGAWVEQGLANAPVYTGNRPSITMGSAAAGSSVSPAQSFVFTSGGTVAGCFINNGGSATKDDTTGVLYSAGDFSSSRAVLSGDTLNVTYTATV